MSRVGLSPVKIPDGVEVTLTPTEVRAKGKLGELTCRLSRAVKVEKDNDRKVILVKPVNPDDDEGRPIWGTMRANINNIILGVSRGNEKTLELNGVGYRANVQGSTLVLSLGKTNDDKMPIPKGLTVKVDKNDIIITGADKDQVGAFAAVCRALRPVEPYKGKGIRYKGEYVQRKEGKKK